MTTNREKASRWVNEHCYFPVTTTVESLTALLDEACAEARMDGAQRVPVEMTDDERQQAAFEGFVSGTWFLIAERLGLPWKELRGLTMPEFLRRLRERRPDPQGAVCR